jgi:hypothetical protein
MNKNPLDSLVEVINATGAAPPHNAFPETLQRTQNRRESTINYFCGIKKLFG